MDPQRPNGEVSDAHRRHHTQPCDANDVQGGAEWEEKGKAQVRGYSPISLQDPPTVPACNVDEANMEEPASALANSLEAGGPPWGC